MKASQEQRDFIKKIIGILHELQPDTDVSEWTITDYPSLKDTVTRIEIAGAAGKITLKLDEKTKGAV